jgi:MOSC domain-containing protein YiiM
MNTSMEFTNGTVLSVSMSPSHSFSKYRGESINLLQGLGVEGDAHSGKSVQHLSRITKNPKKPNLRQVHLIHAELFEELAESGFELAPGMLGENITTANIALLSLPTGSRLRFAELAVIEITGLRNPCNQIDTFMPGLLAAVVRRDSNGNLVRKCGVMATVVTGGLVQPGDPIEVVLPSEPYTPLQRV